MVGWRNVVARIGVGLTLAFLLAIVVFMVVDPHEFLLDPLRPLVFGLLLALPATFGILATRGHPALLTDAALTSLLVIPTSMSGVTLVMIVPVAFFLLARIPVRTRVHPARALLRVLLSAGASIGVFAALVFETADRCISGSFGQMCTDGAVTVVGLFLSIGAVALAWHFCRLLATPVSSPAS